MLIWMGIAPRGTPKKLIVQLVRHDRDDILANAVPQIFDQLQLLVWTKVCQIVEDGIHGVSKKCVVARIQARNRGLSRRYISCAFASGHSPQRMLYITVSRIVPSRRSA